MPSEPINAVAAAWFARLLSPDCGDDDREDFERWCAADESHADAFVAVAQCHADAARLKDDDALRASARAARMHTRSRDGRARLRPFARFAAAAALLLAIAGGGLWLARERIAPLDRHVTLVGEQRSIVLADGTRVQMDTDTALSVQFGERTRELVLDRGRIRVDVAQDATRAFAVRSGRGVIRDIGTRFEVARFGEDVTVTLMSGVVSVALQEPSAGDDAHVLESGQQVRVGAHGGVGPATAVDLAAASDWTSGTLTFKDRRLGDLLEEMNRYSRTKIHVADPTLGLVRVSGVFRAGDQTSLLQALQAGWAMRSTRVSADEVVLSSTR